MKARKFSRRRFLAATLLSAPALAVADARWLEPTWVKVRQVRLGNRKPTHRVVHLTDVHHKGDRVYLHAVVSQINALSPDFVCFTGDLIEEIKAARDKARIQAVDDRAWGAMTSVPEKPGDGKAAEDSNAE